MDKVLKVKGLLPYVTGTPSTTSQKEGGGACRAGHISVFPYLAYLSRYVTSASCTGWGGSRERWSHTRIGPLGIRFQVCDWRGMQLFFDPPF